MCDTLKSELDIPATLRLEDSPGVMAGHMTSCTHISSLIPAPNICNAHCHDSSISCYGLNLNGVPAVQITFPIAWFFGFVCPLESDISLSVADSQFSPFFLVCKNCCTDYLHSLSQHSFTGGQGHMYTHCVSAANCTETNGQI